MLRSPIFFNLAEVLKAANIAIFILSKVRYIIIGLCKHEEKRGRAVQAVKMLQEDISTSNISVLTSSVSLV